MIVRIVVAVLVVLLIAGVVVLKRWQNPAVPPMVQSLYVTAPIDFVALRASGLPVVIDYGADSCIPCKEMAPVLVALHDELKGKAIIMFVDVWKYRDLADGIPLQVIPTQVFIDADGKPFTPPESLGIPFTKYSNRDTNEHVFTTHEGGLSKEQLLAVLDAMGMKK
jgi:thioredoxin 1